MARRFGLAIIGFGRIARVAHFPNIISNPNLHLKYVVDIDTSTASNFVSQYQNDITVVSPEELQTVLSDESVDATFICTTADSHAQYINDSLKAGKSVFCEKPLTPNLASTESCYTEAKNNGKLLFCGFNRRFDPSISSIYQRVQIGEIGQVKNMRTIIRDKDMPPTAYLKTSGGIFADCVVHEFDLAGWFMGGLPSVVYAQGHAWVEDLREFGDVDQAIVVMKYPNGAIVSIDAARGTAYGEDHRIEIHGSNGVCLQREATFPTFVNCLGHAGEVRENRCTEFHSQWKDSYAAELHGFVNALRGKTDNVVTAEECANVAKVIAACNESLKTGNPVHL